VATLAKDKPRQYENTGGHPAYNEIPAIATDIIYNGAAVGESSSTGTGRPLVAADNFMGFCIENCDNSAGAAGDKLIKVLKRGVAWLTVTNGDNINDYGDTVYASDDDTFTMASTGNTAIGKLIRYDSASGKCLVDFEALAARSI
jgi:hypothetical protein